MSRDFLHICELLTPLYSLEEYNRLKTKIINCNPTTFTIETTPSRIRCTMQVFEFALQQL